VTASSQKAVLYVRVSSLEQEKEGYSLDAQEKMGHDYALKKGMEIVRVWKITESAWKSERSAFNQMVEYVKKHQDVGHIIFDVMDRMTRNDFDKLKIYSLIRDYGKSAHFSRTNKIFNRESGSDDEFMFDIEVAVAKKMSNDISRKTQMGMLEKAEQGIYPSVAPVGYRNNPLTHLVDVDEEKAPHIKRAFSLMASGNYSLSMLADKLRNEGFTNKGRGKIGKSALDFLLKNPFYHGVYEWKGKTYRGSHTTLISKELFDRSHEVLTGRNRPHVSRKNFPFNNLMSCGLCGCKVLGEQKKHRYNYYHCTFSKGRHKGDGYIPEERIASLLGESIQKITFPSDIIDWLKDALRERTKNTASLQENRLTVLKAQHEKAKNRLSRLYDAKFDGDIEEEVFRAKEIEYKAHVVHLEGEMVEQSGAITPERLERGLQTLELTKTFYPQYVHADHPQKAAILRFVASNYTLTHENIYPTYKRPFSFLAEGPLCSIKLPGLDSNQQPFD
jgi:site-specific DNA recombinase